MNDKFEQIKKRYILSFEAKQKELQLAWQEKDIEQLLFLLHKLAGSSGGYGYPRISQTCQIIKEHLVVKEKYDYDIVQGFLDSIFVEFNSEMERIHSNPLAKIIPE